MSELTITEAADAPEPAPTRAEHIEGWLTFLLLQLEEQKTLHLSEDVIGAIRDTLALPRG
jgi:hypothetical protein